MTYVVDEGCIKCKHMDCVDVCPVDCFYEGENMLVIHPDECIDCGVCEPECPIEAIHSDTDDGMESWGGFPSSGFQLDIQNGTAGAAGASEVVIGPDKDFKYHLIKMI